jgi:hypothetical protein
MKKTKTLMVLIDSICEPHDAEGVQLESPGRSQTQPWEVILRPYPKGPTGRNRHAAGACREPGFDRRISIDFGWIGN